jgi:hypothetical protein
VDEWLLVPRQKGDAVRVGAATIEVLQVGGTRLDIVTTEPIHIVTTPAKWLKHLRAWHPGIERERKGPAHARRRRRVRRAAR